MRNRFAALAFLLLTSVLLSGCFFQHPLTKGPSDDLNTWLLGVWEHTTEKGKVYRLTSAPLAPDRYRIIFRELGRTPAQTKTWEFEAWPSRVGSATFLTLQCVSSAGEVPVGAYLFCHAQLINQTNVLLRSLQLDSPAETTSYKLRHEVRSRLKNNTLYAPNFTAWTKVGEVYWEKSGAEGTFTPIRNPPPLNEQL